MARDICSMQERGSEHAHLCDLHDLYTSDGKQDSYKVSFEDRLYIVREELSERVHHLARFFFGLLENIYFLFDDLCKQLVPTIVNGYSILKDGVVQNQAVDQSPADVARELFREKLGYVHEGIMWLRYAFEDKFYPDPRWVHSSGKEPVTRVINDPPPPPVEDYSHLVQLPPFYMGDEVGVGIVTTIPEECEVDYSVWEQQRFIDVDPPAVKKELSQRVREELLPRLASLVDFVFIQIAGLWKTASMITVRVVNIIEKGAERLWKGVILNRPNLEISPMNGEYSTWLYEKSGAVHMVIQMIHESLHRAAHSEFSPNQETRYPGFSPPAPHYANVRYQVYDSDDERVDNFQVNMR
jgi:hypothetical protein